MLLRGFLAFGWFCFLIGVIISIHIGHTCSTITIWDKIEAIVLFLASGYFGWLVGHAINSYSPSD